MADGSRPTLVLVVDDFPETIDILAESLQARGFGVTLSLSAEEALRRLLDESEPLPDVIVMDLAMPRVDGLEATRRLKAVARTGHIPVVLYTAHRGPELDVAAARAGCASVVGKPASAANIVAAIEGALHASTHVC